MTWEARVQECVYVSPSGVRTTLQYENVAKSFDRKTTAFEFPDADGTYVQDLGRTGRRYPMRIFFSGETYDLEADAFETSLFEKGIGKLEHPMYGTIDVVPFGAVNRRDDLKTAANQAVLELTFWETIRLVYPLGQSDPASRVLTAVEECNAASAERLDEATDLDTAVERTSFKSAFQQLLDRTSVGLDAIAETTDAVRKRFETIESSINQGIDVLISDPLTLAFQTVQLIQAPARAAAAIEARLSAYRDLAESIITGDGAFVEAGLDSANSNRFHARDLFVSSYITGSILSVVNNEFSTKTEAIAAADSILTLFDSAVEWRDGNFESLEQIDTGESYQQLQEATAIVVGFLVEISFTLKQERRRALDRNRTVIDLVAELYGTIDDDLDFFIESNGLSGSEILEIPAGKEIVYYV